MLLAHLSDPHIGAASANMLHGMAPGETLERAIRQLLALHVLPDAVIVSGDLAERGTPEEYRELRRLLAPLPMPVYLMVGNHDDRDALRNAFPEHGYLNTCGTFVQYAFDAAQWRIVVLDSLDVGVSSGRLCDERLGWLEQELDACRDRDVVVFVHHQPFAIGVPHVDRSRLLHGGRFGEAVRRHGRVRRVLCGHVHRAMHASWEGCSVTTCPSVFFQFAADFRSEGRYVPASEMPGYQLHRFTEEQLLTYTLAIA